MKTIKIVAPSFDNFKAVYGEDIVNDRFGSKSTDGFMQLLSHAIVLVGGNALRYKHAELTEEGLTADINVSRLPRYENVVSHLNQYDFEQEMIIQIGKGNKRYGADGPIASPETLRQPLSLWCESWLTVYLWTIMRVAYTIWKTPSHLKPTGIMDNEELMSTVEAQLADTKIDEVDYARIASEYVNHREIARIIEKAVAVKGDEQEVTAAKNTATEEVLVLIGELLETIKTDDEYFKDDDYYM